MKRFFIVLLAFVAFFAPSALFSQTSPVLRFGVFPDAGSLPILVASQENLFAQEGVQVKIVSFQSAVERDAAFQAGSLDGMVADLIAAGLLVDKGFPIQVTSELDGRFGIVTAPQSGATAVKDLASTPIGGSLHTIIQFFSDTALRSAGVPSTQIQYLSVPKMPLRMEMVASGQIKAAALAEPFLSVAVSRGAHLVASSEGVAGAQAIVLFSSDYLKANKAALTAFYRAYDKAAAEINARQDDYRDFLVSALRFPEQVKASYRFDHYSAHHSVPTKSAKAAVDWMKAEKLVSDSLDPGKLTGSTADY